MARQTRARRDVISKRRTFPAALMLLVALAGCSSTPNTASSSATPMSPSAASSQSASDTTSPSSSPAAGGSATNFCGAFKEIKAVNDAPSGDPASVGAQMQAAAADMRKYAPDEIQKAANTYADVIDNIGKAAASGSLNESALTKAMSDGIAGHAKDIGTVAVWVAKNCKL